MTERHEIINKVKDTVSKEFIKIVSDQNKYKVLLEKLIV